MNDAQGRNISLVGKILGSAAKGQWETANHHISDALIAHLPPGLPFGGDYKGPEGFRKSVEALGSFFTDFKPESSEMLEHDDRVIIINRLSARIASNGKPITIPQVSIWKFEGDQVVDITPYYYDTKTICDTAA